MRARQIDDPAVFRDAVDEYLHRDEPRHNLVLGLLRVLIDQPEVYSTFYLRLVEDVSGATVAASLRTPPHLVTVAQPRSDAALQALVDDVAACDVPPPGVIGSQPEAEHFARRYCEVTGSAVTRSMELGIHVLQRVSELRGTTGAARVAGPDDLDLVLEWMRAFHTESAPNEPWDEEQSRKRLVNRLAARSGEGIRVWEDGGPVCVAGFAGETRTGIRVGPVYTPPGLRGRGYATGLVASVSQELLDGGRRFCFLYTDMANPTSNAIYRRIGYRLHCRSSMIWFE